MAETAEVIDLNERRRTVALVPEKYDAKFTTYEPDISGLANKETEVEDLYVGDTPTARLIGRVRQLLADAEGHLTRAQELLSDDVVAADDEISLLQAAMPELFCCRELSDGLGAITLGIFHGLQNRQGAPLNLDQIFAIKESVAATRSNPFLPFPEALDLIDRMVDAGVKVEPAESDVLGDILAGG
jgi:hypothetical protein